MWWDTTDTLFAILVTPAVTAIIGGMTLGYRKSVLKMQAKAGADPAQMQTLMETARQMEQRIGYLERVLDTEAPGWRGRSEAA